MIKSNEERKKWAGVGGRKGWKEGNRGMKNWGERVQDRLGDEEGERLSEKVKRIGVRHNEKERKIVPSFCSLLALPLLHSLPHALFLPSSSLLSLFLFCSFFLSLFTVSLFCSLFLSFFSLLFSLSLSIIYWFLICYKTESGDVIERDEQRK